MEYRIAIIVQNIIQWYSIRKLAIFLKNQPNIHIDIYLYDPKSSTNDFHAIATETRTAILLDDFIISQPQSQNLKYKICIAPYSNMITLECQYKLGYCYGAATTKPAFTLDPSAKKGFHGLFLHDTYGAEIFSIYGKTYIVPDLYLQPIKCKNIDPKPTILFLPTYHEPSTIPTIMSLRKLKKHFHIIAKAHHGTEKLQEEKRIQDLLKTATHELYPSSYPIQNLFEKCSVVLSDNSGAAMDALYSNVPIAIAATNINQSIADIDTIQSILASRGIIPYSNTLDTPSIKKIITTAMSTEQQKIQKQASKHLFPVKNGGAKYWFSIIQKYLNDEVDQNYCKIHDYIFDQFDSLRQENIQLSDKVINLEKTLQTTKTQLNSYENSRLHQAINRFQHIIH